jgi:hypothetical protein
MPHDVMKFLASATSGEKSRVSSTSSGAVASPSKTSSVSGTGNSVSREERKP